MNIITVSGGMDCLHPGHVNLINHASVYGKVIVILNSDQWLLRKKGYFFMTWEDRAAIVRSLKNVSHVMAVDDNDGTVCSALKSLRPTYFANGGDRIDGDNKESEICKELGIIELFGIGGGKIASSSDLVRRAHVKLL